jgi:hypothetical protein
MYVAVNTSFMVFQLIRPGLASNNYHTPTYVCPVSFMTYHLIRNMSNTTGVTSGAGTFYPSRTQWFIAGLFLVWFKSLVYPLLSLNCSLFVEPHQWCNGKRVCWCVVVVRCEPRSYQLKDHKRGIYCYIHG